MKTFLKNTLVARALFTNTLLAGLFAFMVASPILAVASPAVSSVAAADNPCEGRVLGIPPWYRGLTTYDAAKKDCTVNGPSSDQDGLQKYIWKIVLNVIEMALVIVTYVAVFYILYGGFQFIAGGGSPDTVSKARKTILNAVIGLVVAMSAIAVTNLIFSIIP